MALLDIAIAEELGIDSKYIDKKKEISPGRNILGINAADAAEEAAKRQNQAAMAGIDLQERTTQQIRDDLSPYREAGLPSISEYQNLLTPGGQRDYLMDNPLFDYLAGDATRRLTARQAARNKLYSGETPLALQNAIFGLGSGLIQDQRNSLMNMISTGQNSAAMTGNNAQQGTSSIINLLTGNANAQGAAGIAAANAQQQGAANAGGLAMAAISAFCDVRMKENIEYLGEVNGLSWYQWDWTEDAKDIVGDQPSEGPLAQELAEVCPELVFMVGDYLKVNMEGLMNVH